MELKIEIMHIRFLRIAKWRNGQIYNAYRFFELETTLEFIIPLPFCLKQWKPSTLTKPLKFCIWNEMDTVVENVLQWNATEFNSVNYNQLPNHVRTPYANAGV